MTTLFGYLLFSLMEKANAKNNSTPCQDNP
jgi:hypothetical protein